MGRDDPALVEDFASPLPVQEIAERFRIAAEHAYGGSKTRKLVSVTKGVKLEFFTPEQGNDPFAAFDDRPEFAVGVSMPAGGAFAGATPVLVQLLVYGDSAPHKVQLVGFAADFTRKNAARRLVAELKDAIQR